jgi:hypothetical protein
MARIGKNKPTIGIKIAGKYGAIIFNLLKSSKSNTNDYYSLKEIYDLHEKI